MVEGRSSLDNVVSLDEIELGGTSAELGSTAGRAPLAPVISLADPPAELGGAPAELGRRLPLGVTSEPAPGSVLLTGQAPALPAPAD